MWWRLTAKTSAPSNDFSESKSFTQFMTLLFYWFVIMSPLISSAHHEPLIDCPLPTQLFRGADTVLTKNAILSLPLYPHCQYVWSTKTSTPYITITTPGIYSITIRDSLSGCFVSDTINVCFSGNGLKAKNNQQLRLHYLSDGSLQISPRQKSRSMRSIQLFAKAGGEELTGRWLLSQDEKKAIIDPYSLCSGVYYFRIATNEYRYYQVIDLETKLEFEIK
jgi:hypothetical protein